MLSLATIKALQIYGIAIAISITVAVLIKILVLVTSRIERVAQKDQAPQETITPIKQNVPDEVVVAISAAISVVIGPHRILHIGESSHSWSHEGRSLQHAHQPKH